MPNKTTVILGAGFSKNSGVPVQLEFSNYLIEDYAIGDFDEAVSKIIERYMKMFWILKREYMSTVGGYINFH